MKNDNNEFTKEEIRILKQIAQDKIFFENCFLKDKEGKKYPYRNRFEAWDDAYTNLKHLGFNHEDIIKQIGEKKNKKDES